MQTSNMPVAPNTQQERRVSFGVDTPNPTNPVGHSAVPTDTMSAEAAGAAAPSASPLQTEAEVASKVSFHSLHPTAQQGL